MRYLLVLLMTAVTLPVLGYNEAVSAISYNPSRLGAYTYLKAVQGAHLQGGLKISAENHSQLNVQSASGHAVTLRDVNSSHNVADNSCSTVENGWCGGVNTIQTVQPVGSNANTSAALPNTIVEGTGTVFSAGSNLITASNIGDNQGTNVALSGGTLTVARDGYIGGFANAGTNENVTKLNMISQNAVQFGTNFTAQNQFQLGNVTITCPGGNCNTNKRTEYKFVRRIDTNRTGVLVLGAK